jgi:HSP20 family protein
MTISRRPSPFGELLSLRQAMDRLLEDSFVRPRAAAWSGTSTDGAPLPLDVSTTADALVVEAALPGARPDDVEITVEDGTLTIRASTASEEKREDGGYLVQEIRRGELSRSISLPSGLEPDRGEASFEHGILTLRIPRAEQVKPRQIRINPGTSSAGTSSASTSSASTNGRSETAAGEHAQSGQA